jgi:hypothetical protein
MMNERLKELLTPKLKEWGGDTGDNFSEELEKFAELIIKECANQLIVKGNSFKDDKDIPYYGSGFLDGAELIKDHFGVE